MTSETVIERQLTLLRMSARVDPHLRQAVEDVEGAYRAQVERIAALEEALKEAADMLDDECPAWRIPAQHALLEKIDSLLPITFATPEVPCPCGPDDDCSCPRDCDCRGRYRHKWGGPEYGWVNTGEASAKP